MKAIVNGKEIKVLSKNDVGAEFTKKVVELLQQGFIYNYAEGSRVSQDEELKAHLSNDGGKTVYKIYLDRKSLDHWKDGVFLYVKKYVLKYADQTIWNSNGEVVFEKIFYCINDKYHEDAIFVDDEKIFEEICQMQKERLKSRSEYGNDKKLPETANRVAYTILKKRNGFKTMKRNEVEFVGKRDGKFYVKLNRKGRIVNL